MKKRVFGRKLSRESATRQALFVSLMASFIKVGTMKTTLAKAKAIQGDIDGFVILAKKDTLSSQRRIISLLRNDGETAKVLMTKVKKNFDKRNSGFTRILRLGPRKGDAAEMVKLEWVENNENVPTKTKSS